MDYRPLFQMHIAKDADLTVAFLPIRPETSGRFGVAQIDDECGEMGGRIIDYQEKPVKSDYRWASLTIYLFKPEVLTTVLNENAQNPLSHEFGRDIIPEMLDKYKVYGYKFRGYWGYTRTIDEFWQTNMDLLGANPKINLKKWEVRTNLDHDRLRDRPPAKIGKSADLQNSFVHNGCEVEGRIENSILFPGVKVARDAVIKNSILFFDTVIEAGAKLDKTITDFDVNIGNSCVIGFKNNSVPNREFPKLLNSGITLVGKAVQIPPHTQVGKNCIIAPAMQENDFQRKVYESGLTIR
jgi:glucose-1-phosphate adenylyltransferase